MFYRRERLIGDGGNADEHLKLPCEGLQSMKEDRLSPIVSCGFGRFQPPNERESRAIVGESSCDLCPIIVIL